MDINHTEEIIFPVNHKILNHNYSDNERFSNIIVSSYSIEEVLSEKLRSLIQRKYTSPRDCYDIWYLKNNYLDLDWGKIKNAFLKKATNKDIVFESVEQLLNTRKEYILKRHWNNQLGNQISEDRLPKCELVVQELKQFFESLF